MLELQDVHTYYGESHILQGVSLKVPKDSIVALLGRNGMGKTTTIHSIMGFTPSKSGKIEFKGSSIAGLPSYKIAQAGIALIPQSKRIFSSLTVEENIAIGQKKWISLTRDENLSRISEFFPALKQKSDHRGNELSGGEQQMLSFARALATNPDLILMDEPFEGLAPAIVKDLSDCISRLKKQGLSILLVEQDIRAALKLADYVYIMGNGRIIYEGTPEQLQADESVLKNFLSVQV